MSTTTQEKTGPSATVDLNGLKRFLEERKLGDTAGLRSENISFGHSNEVHLVHFDGNSWALRRPPRGPLLPTAHDVMREYRVLKALQATAVPVPRVYAACDDASYIGAPFYLMEYMTGQVVRADNQHFVQTPELRRRISDHRAIAVGEPPIRDHQGIAARIEFLPRLGDSRRDIDHVPLAAQRMRQQFVDRPFILDQEDTLVGHARAPRSAKAR